jgi:hypothetical protein
MAIENHTDPKTRKPYMLAVGKVTAAYVNDIKEPKTYTGLKGEAWTPTKRLSIVVDGTRIDLGMSEKDQIRAKDLEEKYQDVVKGVEVSVVIEENGEYKGVKQYRAKTSGITVLDVSGAEAPSASKPSGGSAGGAAQSFKPKDMTGVEAGQSLNGAMNFLLTYGVDPTNENIVEYGKKVHQATVQVKAIYKELNPSVPEYDAGARCGLAVLTACKLVGTEQDFESGVINIAQDILANVLEPITQYVKSPAGTQTTPKVSRVVPKKPLATKAKPVIKEVPPEIDEPPEEDEDAPF